MRMKNVPGKMTARWRKVTDAVIEAAGQAARIYYHESLESSGDGVDRFFGESTDWRTPFTDSGGDPLTYSGSSLVVSGHYYTGLSGGTSIRDKDVIRELGIGELEPGDVIMIASATNVPASSFYNVHYVTLDDVEDRTYRLVGAHPFGMMGVQFWRLLLRQAVVGDETG